MGADHTTAVDLTAARRGWCEFWTHETEIELRQLGAR